MMVGLAIIQRATTDKLETQSLVYDKPTRRGLWLEMHIVVRPLHVLCALCAIGRGHVTCAQGCFNDLFSQSSSNLTSILNLIVEQTGVSN
jgi:hypothetical protein